MLLSKGRRSYFIRGRQALTGRCWESR